MKTKIELKSFECRYFDGIKDRESSVIMSIDDDLNEIDYISYFPSLSVVEVIFKDGEIMFTPVDKVYDMTLAFKKGNK